MVKKRQNINLLYDCEKRYSQKPWYSKDWLNALMGRLAYLDDDEVKLILDLTEQFKYHRVNDINSMLYSAFCKIPSSRLSNASKILFAPLKSPYYHVEDIKRKKRLRSEGYNMKLLAEPGKSCDLIYRLMQAEYPAKYQKYAQKIEMCSAPSDIVKFYKKNSVIVLWDDFVGSGDTAFTAIAGIQHYLSANKMSTNENDYLIVCMCAMQSGIDILQYFGLDCFAAEVYKKAISDDVNYSTTEREQRRNLMQKVERKVVKNSLRDFSLGYERSEALLSIIDKCPNNTFPFYWYKSQYRVPPVFYRHK